MRLIRKECNAGEVTNFNFDVKGWEFLVKNFSASDIFVSLEGDEDQNKMIKIPTMCSQVCLINTVADNSCDTNCVNVIASETGEVEIQVIHY